MKIEVVEEASTNAVLLNSLRFLTYNTKQHTQNKTYKTKDNTYKKQNNTCKTRNNTYKPQKTLNVMNVPL